MCWTDTKDACEVDKLVYTSVTLPLKQGRGFCSGKMRRNGKRQSGFLSRLADSFAKGAL